MLREKYGTDSTYCRKIISLITTPSRSFVFLQIKKMKFCCFRLHSLRYVLPIATAAMLFIQTSYWCWACTQAKEGNCVAITLSLRFAYLLKLFYSSDTFLIWHSTFPSTILYTECIVTAIISVLTFFHSLNLPPPYPYSIYLSPGKVDIIIQFRN